MWRRIQKCGSNEIEVVANAAAAIRRAKDNGAESIYLIDEDMTRRTKERAQIQRDLRAAIDQNALHVQYQPLIARRGVLAGFGALARWRHSVRGNIPPDTFIPVAEESGLILSLSRWVLQNACLEAATWKHPLTVAVNISASQFKHEDLPALIKLVLMETGLAPERLELEITEGALISDSEHALAILLKLKEMGVQIALDDFGTGYSSLIYLRDFPISKIKIDRSSVANLSTQPSSKAIIHAIINIVHAMNLQVTAEGVETDEQLRYLLDEGCDMIQGYLVGRPAPIEHFAPFLRSNDFRTIFCQWPNNELRLAGLAERSFKHAV